MVLSTRKRCGIFLLVLCWHFKLPVVIRNIYNTSSKTSIKSILLSSKQSYYIFICSNRRPVNKYNIDIIAITLSSLWAWNAAFGLRNDFKRLIFTTQCNSFQGKPQREMTWYYFLAPFSTSWEWPPTTKKVCQIQLTQWRKIQFIRSPIKVPILKWSKFEKD